MQVAATGNGDAPADQTRDPERTVTGSIRLGILSMAWQTILHRFWYSNLKLRLLAEGAGEGLQAQAGDRTVTQSSGFRVADAGADQAHFIERTGPVSLQIWILSMA